LPLRSIEVGLVNGANVFWSERQVAGLGAVLCMLDGSRTRDGKHCRSLGNGPRESDLMGGAGEPASDLLQHRVSGQFPGESRATGWTVAEEPDAARRTVVDDAFANRLPEKGVEAVLHGGDGRDLFTALDLVDGDVGQADRADLSGLLEIGHGTEALFERHVGIHRVELVECDLLDAERLERTVAGLAQLLRTRVSLPAPRRSYQSAFGRDQDTLPVAAPFTQRPGDEPFVVSHVILIETVNVGGIDQRLAGGEGGVNDLDADIFRRAAVEREVHAAVADDGNGGEVLAEWSGAHGENCRLKIEDCRLKTADVDPTQK